MRTSRLWRLAAACRPSIVAFPGFVLVLTAASAASAADRLLSGTIADQSGQPLPRAFVRVVDAAGREITTTFSDELGHFRFGVADACRIQATLSGFEPASIDLC